MAICDLSLHSHPGTWVQLPFHLSFEKSQGLTSQLGGLELMSQAGRWSQSPALTPPALFSPPILKGVCGGDGRLRNQHSRRGGQEINQAGDTGSAWEVCVGSGCGGGYLWACEPHSVFLACPTLALSHMLHTLGEISVPHMVWASFLPGFASP